MATKFQHFAPQKTRWRLIKGWETPRERVYPQDLLPGDQDGSHWANLGGSKTCFWENDMRLAPEWFAPLTELPDGWIFPERIPFDGHVYAWIRTKGGAVGVAERMDANNWEFRCQRVHNLEIEAVYPINEPKF